MGGALGKKVSEKLQFWDSSLLEGRQRWARTNKTNKARLLCFEFKISIGLESDWLKQFLQLFTCVFRRRFFRKKNDFRVFSRAETHARS